LQAGNYRKARETLSQITWPDLETSHERNVLEAGACLLEGDEAARSREYPRAADLYARAGELNPQVQPEMRFRLIHVARQQEIEEPSLVPLLTAALGDVDAQQLPADICAYAGYLLALHGIGDERWAAICDRAFRELRAQGHRHLAAGRHAEALGALSRALVIRPANAAVLDLLARVYYLEGNSEQGLIALRRAAQAEPEPARLLRLALLCEQTGRLQEAWEAVGPVPVAEYPDPGLVLRLQVRLLVGQGRFAEALAAAEHPLADVIARSLAPALHVLTSPAAAMPRSDEDPTATYVHAVLAFRDGRWDEADAWATRAMAGKLADRAHLLHAHVLLARGQSAEAEAAAGSAAGGRAPAHALALQGLIAARQGRCERALECWGHPLARGLTGQGWIPQAEVGYLLQAMGNGAFREVLERLAAPTAVPAETADRVKAVAAYALAVAAVRRGDHRAARELLLHMSGADGDPRVQLVAAVTGLALGETDRPEYLPVSDPELLAVQRVLEVTQSLRRGQLRAANTHMAQLRESGRQRAGRVALQAQLAAVESRFDQAFSTSRVSGNQEQVHLATGLFLGTLPDTGRKAGPPARSLPHWAYLWWRKDPDRALRLLQSMVSERPDLPAWRIALAQVCLEQALVAFQSGKDPTAYLDRVMSLDPGVPLEREALNLQAVWLAVSRRVPEAVALFQRARDLEASPPSGLLTNLARAQDLAGDAGGAADTWAEALALWDGSRDADDPFVAARSVEAARRGCRIAAAAHRWDLVCRMAVRGLQAQPDHCELAALLVAAQAGRINEVLASPQPDLHMLEAAAGDIGRMASAFPDEPAVVRVADEVRRQLMDRSAHWEAMGWLDQADGGLTAALDVDSGGAASGELLYRRVWVRNRLAQRTEDPEWYRRAEADLVRADACAVVPTNQTAIEQIRPELRRQRLTCLARCLTHDVARLEQTWAARETSLDAGEAGAAPLVLSASIRAEWDRLLQAAEEGLELAQSLGLNELGFADIRQRCRGALQALKRPRPGSRRSI
jgi:tetratricopeptide (TPR) repeat protein